MSVATDAVMLNPVAVGVKDPEIAFPPSEATNV